MRRLAPLLLLALLAGCAAADSGAPSLDPGPIRIGGSYQHRAQVMRDVAAMVEGMDGARLSRLRRAGM